MAIVINGSGTVTGLSAGGLPDNTVDNGTMADDAIGVAELSATGTASSSTFLRGDNAWATAGGDNTPAFSMIGTGTQDFADNAYVKILFEGSEEFDTDSACASSRFTVPSGEGGKYFVQLNVVGKTEFDSEDRLISKFYVNGNPDNRTYNKVRSIMINDNITVNHATILNLSAGDYVEVYCYKDGNAAGVDGGTFGRFSGFKLVGV